MSALLKHTTIGELVFDKRELFQLEVNDTIEQALQVLKERNILSAPAWDRKKSQYVGMVDVWDIMTQFALCTFWTDKIETINSTCEKIEPGLFKRTTVRDLFEKNPDNKPICIAEPIDPASILLGPMGDQGILRCLVRQRDDHTRAPIYKLLSRTDLIKFIWKNIDQFERQLSMKVSEWGTQMHRGYHAKVLTGSTDFPALQVFQKMWQQKIAAVPIVDKEGQIVATLSASDLRGMTVDKLETVLLPPIHYLKEMGTYREPVTCTPDCTLKEVVKKALEAKVHRVWIVNKAMHPEGVVSFSDILSTLKEIERR